MPDGHDRLALLRTAGHIVFYGVVCAACALLVVIGIVSWADRDRPTYWGTFTETSTSCDQLASRRACTISGRWVSDDGTIVKGSVVLDGSVGKGASLPAAYQPGGLMGDDANDVVHAGIGVGAGLWMPWLAVAGCGMIAWRQRRRWDREAAASRHRARHAGP